MKKIPQWILDDLSKWKTTLNLQDWQITIVLSNIEALAQIHPQPKYLNAQLEIRNDVPDDLSKANDISWQWAIPHELLHLKLARLVEWIEEELIVQMSPREVEIYKRQLVREIEPVVESLAVVLWELHK